MFRLALCAALLVSLAFGPAAAGDSLIAESPCPPASAAVPELRSGCTGVSAHDGRVVWSTYEGASGGFVLMSASRGLVARVPVAARALPFDADLGADALGRVVAVYSRCAGDPGGPPAGCAVREYAFAAGATEHALLRGVSSDEPLLPSRWGTRVAIARRTAAGTRRAALCPATGTPRCRTLPGGPAGIRSQWKSAGPTAIDVDAHRVAVGWYWWENETVRRHAILVGAFAAKTATMLVKVGAGMAGNASVHSPVLDGGFVYYARGGATCDYQSTPNAIGRYDLAHRTLQEVPSPSLASLAVDAGSVYYAACGTVSSLPGASGSTLIERADPPPFGRPGALDPSRAAPCPAPRAASGWASRTIGRPAWAPWTLALAGTPSGASIALWPTSGALELAARPAGGAFGAVRRLRGPAEPGTDAWVASDDAGDVVAAWRGSRARGALVQATVGTVAGHLSAPQTLDRDPTAPDLLGVPLVAMSPDGVAVVVWTEPPPPRGGDGKVLASFRAAGADRFGAPVQVAASPSFSRVLAVAAGAAGRALVAIGGFPRGQHVTVLEGTAGGFAAPADLGAPRGAPTQAAATLGPDGAATLAWSAGGAIQVATRAAGAGFAPIATVSTAGVPAGRTLSLAARDGRVALAWAEADVRRTVARMIVADGSVGARLGTPRALTLRRGSIGDLRLALGDRGAAGLAWRLTCSPNNSRVLSATRRPGATRFDAETVASGKDRSARAPAVAIGPRSRPTVAWVAGPRPPAKAVVRVAVPRR